MCEDEEVPWWQLALDVVALIPLVGAFNNVDEVVSLLKSADNVKYLDEGTELAGNIGKKAINSMEQADGTVAGAVKRAEKIFEGSSDVFDDAVESTLKGGTSAKGLIGHDFEDYLSKTIGGEGSFSAGGRDFDGGIGNRWWEAKSGDYWSMLEENPSKLAKFKSDMGDRLRIATENGATYELFSNTPIPESIKEWLTKKGISFTELLD